MATGTVERLNHSILLRRCLCSSHPPRGRGIEDGLCDDLIRCKDTHAVELRVVRRGGDIGRESHPAVEVEINGSGMAC